MYSQSRQRYVRDVRSHQYRALITDFGGVVSTSFHGALRGFCIREGLAPDALESQFSLDGGARGLLVDLERGSVGQPEFVEHLAAALQLSPDRLLERILADLDLESAVIQSIDQLRAKGIRVAVLSNSWGDGPFDPYQPFDLDRHFDLVVLSHQVGYRKPEREIFQLTAARLMTDPSECVFVDDVADYLLPAQNLGMAVIHATSPEKTAHTLMEIFKHA